eukprot:2210320-Rhodomonas_salina.3
MSLPGQGGVLAYQKWYKCPSSAQIKVQTSQLSGKFAPFDHQLIRHVCHHKMDYARGGRSSARDRL